MAGVRPALYRLDLTSKQQRATDRIDPINMAQTTEIWWKDLILKTIGLQQSDGPQYTQR
jgi:hypothetical protein